jgi:TRAP-type C4-dicarboxylate transport system permease small subunit
MGDRLRALVFAFTYLLGACMFAGILFSSWGHMVEAWKTGIYTGEGSLRVPIAPVRTIVILGSAITVFFYLVRAFESLRLMAASGKGKKPWTR